MLPEFAKRLVYDIGNGINTKNANAGIDTIAAQTQNKEIPPKQLVQHKTKENIKINEKENNPEIKKQIQNFDEIPVGKSKSILIPQQPNNCIPTKDNTRAFEFSSALGKDNPKPKREYLKRKSNSIAPCNAKHKISSKLNNKNIPGQSTAKANPISHRNKQKNSSPSVNSPIEAQNNKKETSMTQRLSQKKQATNHNDEEKGTTEEDEAFKMSQIQEQINKYKAKIKNMCQLKSETEIELKNISSKIQELDKIMEEESAMREQAKEREIKKIHREQKCISQATEQIPVCNKDKSEIEQLKSEIQKLQKDIHHKDAQYKIKVEGIKKQNEELIEKNKQISNQIIQTQSNATEDTTKQSVPNTNKSISKKEEPIKKHTPTQTKGQKESSIKTLKSDLNISEDQTNAREAVKNGSSSKKVGDSIYNLRNMLIEEDYELNFSHKYHKADDMLISQKCCENGKLLKIYESGKKEMVFSNGVRREVFPDNYTIVYFNNGDVKQTFPEGKVVYFFAEVNTTQTTLADGSQIFKFANTQIEKHYADGTKEISFPDGSYKCIYKNGEEKLILNGEVCNNKEDPDENRVDSYVDVDDRLQDA